jgi:hypothetical protein
MRFDYLELLANTVFKKTSQSICRVYKKVNSFEMGPNFAKRSWFVSKPMGL